MKKLMFALVAAFSFAVMAQEGGAAMPEGKEGHARGPRAAMPGQRGMMSRGMVGGEMMRDPAVMAVMNPKVAEKLGLSEETMKQLRQLDTECRDKLRGIQDKTRQAMMKQANLMKAEKIDEAAVMAAIDELFDGRREMAKAQTKRVIAVRSLLTPEQLAKATEEMKAFRESHRGKRPGADRGPKPEGKGCDKPGSDKPEGEKPVPPPEA